MVLVLTSCSANKQQVGRDTVKLKFKLTAKHVIRKATTSIYIAKYTINVPKKGLVKHGHIYTGDSDEEYQIHYSDSSIIYISNDEWNGSALQNKNLLDIGASRHHRQHLFDTLYFNGIQTNGLCWADKVLGELGIGYLNVNSESKQKYDHALNTIQLICIRKKLNMFFLKRMFRKRVPN